MAQLDHKRAASRPLAGLSDDELSALFRIEQAAGSLLNDEVATPLARLADLAAYELWWREANPGTADSSPVGSGAETTEQTREAIPTIVDPVEIEPVDDARQLRLYNAATFAASRLLDAGATLLWVRSPEGTTDTHRVHGPWPEEWGVRRPGREVEVYSCEPVALSLAPAFGRTPAGEVVRSLDGGKTWHDPESETTTERQYMPGGEPSSGPCPCGHAPDPGTRPGGGCWCLEDGRPLPPADPYPTTEEGRDEDERCGCGGGPGSVWTGDGWICEACASGLDEFANPTTTEGGPSEPCGRTCIQVRGHRADHQPGCPNADRPDLTTAADLAAAPYPTTED